MGRWREVISNQWVSNQTNCRRWITCDSLGLLSFATPLQYSASPFASDYGLTDY